MGVENLEETVMPFAMLQVASVIERNDFIALPQRRHQTIMKEENSTNPEVDYTDIFRGITAESQLDFEETAVICGIGEKGTGGRIINKEYGPFIRYCFVLTDAEIEETPKKTYNLCDNCGECIKACPGHAISNDGEVDLWRCAVYYNGANGTKNPFMPPDALSDMEDRLAIIAGEAKVTPETARKILDKLYFYPPAQHAYQCSICGRACDVACYVHLEEKGVLTKKFRTPFRKREPWQFAVADFALQKE